MVRTVFRTVAVAAATAVFTAFAAEPTFAAGEQIGVALDRITAWIQGILISVGVLTFVLGAGYYLAEGTIGGHERGKTLMVGAIIGVILGFLARPIVNLAASFVSP